jgi:L-2-hydroxyglutarate oxidase LhgO
MDRVDCVVVGAGVAGLAIARRLAMAGLETLILEEAEAFGTGVSARNSEVIHAGIYYPAGGLRARLCVEGNRRLYEFCASHGVDHRRVGKLIVATDDSQRAKLAELKAQALANGVPEMVEMSGAEARTLEPALSCVHALLSPTTGIVDSHGLMLALLGDAEAAGAMLVVLSPITGGRVVDGGFEIDVGGAEPTRIGCRYLINAAGLGSWAVNAALLGQPRPVLPPRHIAKGNYYTLSVGRPPFSRLIYPVPEEGGLGVHLTIDLAGRGRFGPDVEWIESVDYSVDPKRADRFYGAVRRYWPDLADGSLAPDYCGIRPKLTGPGETAAEFLILGEEAHGAPGLVHLHGIESPGLTCCLTLADFVAEQLGH